MKNGSSLNAPMNDLRKDLQAVARDAEALLQATSHITGDRVQAARARAERTLGDVFDRLYDRQMQKRVRKLARNADSYVRDHSWSIIGIVAGVALIAGLLSARRR